MPDARNLGNGLTPVDDPRGVWIVYVFDNGYTTQSAHLTELEALRVVERQGYGNVVFLPFGVDVSDAITEAKR